MKNVSVRDKEFTLRLEGLECSEQMLPALPLRSEVKSFHGETRSKGQVYARPLFALLMLAMASAVAAVSAQDFYQRQEIRSFVAIDNAQTNAVSRLRAQNSDYHQQIIELNKGLADTKDSLTGAQKYGLVVEAKLFRATQAQKIANDRIQASQARTNGLERKLRTQTVKTIKLQSKVNKLAADVGKWKKYANGRSKAHKHNSGNHTKY